MTDALERFFNWQTDADWWWGPLVFLRPPRNVRLTVMLWLKMIGFALLFAAPIEAMVAAIWIYYDYTAAQHHEKRIVPIVATENWAKQTTPEVILLSCTSLTVFGILATFSAHWAWNRRADRLNREPAVPQPVFVNAPGVWPPPPNTKTMQ